MASEAINRNRRDTTSVSSTAGSETDLSSRSRQDEFFDTISSLGEGEEATDHGESSSYNQSPSPASVTATASAQETSSSWKDRDRRQASPDKTELKDDNYAAAMNSSDDKDDGSCERQPSGNRLGRALRSWRTATSTPEPMDMSMTTNSTMMTSCSNHSAVTVCRRNRSVAPDNGDDEGNSSTHTEQDETTQSQHDTEHDNSIHGEEVSLGDIRKAVPPRLDRRAFHTSKKTTSARLNDSDLTSKTCLTYPPSDHDDGDDSSKNSINNNHLEESGALLGDKSEASEGSISFFGPPGRGDKHDNEGDDSSSSNIIMDSSSEGGSIEILQSSLPMLDSSEKEASHKKWRMRVSPSLRNSINSVRIICGKIINQPYVQGFIVALILANAVMMGLSTFDFVDKNPKVKAVFEKVDLSFLIIFTTESAMQFIFHGINLFKDGWLTFDFLIVILSWCVGSLQVFRTMRTLRLVARVKILRRLCAALIEAVPRLAGILFLFILVMYIYAVMVTVLFGDMYERGLTKADYFSRLDVTLFTLFQMITLDWAKIVREVMEIYPLAWAVFFTYLSFTSFILFSLIIGVVCDAVSAIEHDSQLVEMLEKKEDAQERILRLQQRVNYLQKQQKSVLASVQNVLDEIAKEGDGDPFCPQSGLVPTTSTACNGLRASTKSST